LAIDVDAEDTERRRNAVSLEESSYVPQGDLFVRDMYAISVYIPPSGKGVPRGVDLHVKAGPPENFCQESRVALRPIADSELHEELGNILEYAEESSNDAILSVLRKHPSFVQTEISRRAMTITV
jgi:hypothetical protein